LGQLGQCHSCLSFGRPQFKCGFHAQKQGKLFAFFKPEYLNAYCSTNTPTMDSNEVTISLEDSPSSGGSFASTTSGPCCGSGRDLVVDMEVDDKDKGDEQFQLRAPGDLQKSKSTNKCSSDLSGENSYAANKNVAEGKNL